MCGVIRKRRLSGTYIIADSIGGIECLPAELHSPLLAERKVLADSRIDIEHSLANDVVADSRFTEPLRTESRLEAADVSFGRTVDIYAYSRRNSEA